MTSNLHTHTYRCLHASGTDEEYVLRAIESGLTELGFSDHIPWPPYDEDLSKTRMRYREIPEYVASLLSLKEKYKNDIILRIGFEAEYIPAYFSELLPVLREYPIDYLLLGQHVVGSRKDGYIDVFKSQSDPAVLKQYVDSIESAIQTGAFTYLAHPDCFHFTGDPADYEREMERLCYITKAQGMPIEFNLCGLSDGRHYPTPAFWEIASRVGCSVVLGADAHSPDRVCVPEELLMAERFARTYHLNILERARIVTPFYK